MSHAKRPASCLRIPIHDCNKSQLCANRERTTMAVHPGIHIPLGNWHFGDVSIYETGFGAVWTGYFR